MKRMKKIIKTITTILLCVFILPIAVAQQAQQPAQDPGVTPDSFLWGLDKALDQLSLLLTFDKGERARKGLEVARERLLEVKLMVEENKLDAADKAREDHGKNLLKVKESVKYLEEDDSLEEIEELIKIEKELEEHDDEIEETFGELKVKIEVEGEITQQQRDLIDSILTSLQGQTGEVEIEIKNKKNKIKIEIEQETGKSGQEIEIEIENLEKENGVKKQEKALDAISDAEKEFDELLKEAEEEGIVISPEVLDQFNVLLGQARSQFDEGNFIESRKLAKQAENLLDEEKEESEKEIEVEIEKGKAKVKVEIGKEKFKFQLDTTELESIVDEISTRTGLSAKEINAILEVEVKEEEIEIEAEAEAGKTTVEVDVDSKKQRFVLDVTSEEEVIAEIMEKTGLTEEEVKANLEFEVEDKEEAEESEDGDDTVREGEEDGEATGESEAGDEGDDSESADGNGNGDSGESNGNSDSGDSGGDSGDGGGDGGGSSGSSGSGNGGSSGGSSGGNGGNGGNGGDD